MKNFGTQQKRKFLPLAALILFAAAAGLFTATSGYAQTITLVSPNEEVSGEFGTSSSGAGDVDGDGIADVIVGAPNDDPGASPTDAGRAYIFSVATGTVLFTLVSPNEELFGRFGFSVSDAGDVNGDGKADVIVGAYTEDPGASPDDAGRAYIFVNPTPFVFRADEDVEIYRHVDSEGDIHANDDIVFKTGNRPQSIHTGDLTAVDDIEVKKRNKIIGTATAGDEVNNAGEITGGFTENAAVAKIPLPTLPDFDAGDDDIEVDENETLMLDPGNYEKVKVEEKGTLILKSGIYNLESLEMGKESVLSIDASSGPVIINLKEKLEVGEEATMALIGSITLVTFKIAGKDKISLGNGALFFGSILAPEATVELGKGVRFKGSIFAENIKVDKGTRFVSHNFVGAFPQGGAWI